MAAEPPVRRRATIEDVAEAAGVSVATVSRALRNLPNVAASTRQRVAAVAADLAYRADPAASRLAAGRTLTVTVVVPSLSGWYFANVVAGVEAVCAEAGYDVLVVGVGSRRDLGRILGEQQHLERRTDGVVVIDLDVSPDDAAAVAARGVALVTVGRTIEHASSVRIDNVEVGEIAANHLTGLGHRRLGVIGGAPDSPLGFDVSRLRVDGFSGALSASGLTLDTALIEGGNYNIDGGHEAMTALLDRADPPTAVFSLSDEMAFGALMAISERGLTAGADVSVMGVDDHEFARVVGLTTIRQCVSDHGSAAARMLLAAMSRPRDDQTPAATNHVVGDVELVVRSSTARI